MALISTSALWEAARAFFNHCSSPVASSPFCDLERAICNSFETNQDKHLSPCCSALLLIIINCNGEPWKAPSEGMLQDSVEMQLGFGL